MDRRFMKLKYAAIRRHGERLWTAHADMIEFNLGCVVGISGCEKGHFAAGLDRPYVVELSNGTKFLCFMHDYGENPTDEMLSCMGEAANSCVAEECYERAMRNIHWLNGNWNGRRPATPPKDSRGEEDSKMLDVSWEEI